MSHFYDHSLPVFTKGLKALSIILHKAEDHAKANNIPLNDFFTAALTDDMKPLPFQVFVATNTALKALARASFVAPPEQEQSDTTFEDLYTRVDETLAALEKADPAVLAANDGKTFKAPLGPQEFEFTAASYVARFALPNYFFHLVTAYDILRAKGVPIGKMDYLVSFVQ
ncbi:hypothetical protein BJX99DRAFT_241525 [Aspergillus californicus]